MCMCMQHSEEQRLKLTWHAPSLCALCVLRARRRARTKIDTRDRPREIGNEMSARRVRVAEFCRAHPRVALMTVRQSSAQRSVGAYWCARGRAACSRRAAAPSCTFHSAPPGDSLRNATAGAMQQLHTIDATIASGELATCLLPRRIIKASYFAVIMNAPRSNFLPPGSTSFTSKMSSKSTPDINTGNE